MKSILHHFFHSLIEWIFRRPSIGATLVKIGGSLCILTLCGVAISVVFPTEQGPLSLTWDSSSGVPTAMSWIALFIGLALILIGVTLIVIDYSRESRKKVIVIEARGLRDWQGQPLAKAVPRSISGRREQFLVDVRQGLVDGQIVDPKTALNRIASLPTDIARRLNGCDREDITMVLGGLAPVPFLFLLGVLLDDEAKIYFMDWNRNERAWQPLNDDDDGKEFNISGLDQISPGTKRVALSISASYDVLDADIRLVDAQIPILKMDLEGRSTASHWSDKKQCRLAEQFLHTAISLARLGVTEITLFLSCPASLALRLGTVYDKRNLPAIEVNQYEQAHALKFPWSISMPVAGLRDPTVNFR